MSTLAAVRCGGQLWRRGVMSLIQQQQAKYADFSTNRFTQVTVDESGNVATLALNKKPVNSLSLEFLTEINLTIEKLENEKTCKSLILTSAFPKIFCAGLDIMEMYQPEEARLRQFWSTLQDVWLRLYGTSLITMAAINGHSPAGGCLFALCCDNRVMADNYTIGLNETKLGIVAPFWFIDTMKNVVGHRQTEKALQLGSMFTSQQALSIGLVDTVVSESEVLPTAQAQLKEWMAIPAHARNISKMLMRKPTIDKLIARKEDDITHFVTFIMRDGTQKSLGKYLESLKKRKS